MKKGILWLVMTVFALCLASCDDEQGFGKEGNTTFKITATLQHSGAESRAVLSDEQEKVFADGNGYVFLWYNGTTRNADLLQMIEMQTLPQVVDLNPLLQPPYMAIIIGNTTKAALESAGVIVGTKLEALFSATYPVNTTDNQPETGYITWSDVQTVDADDRSIDFVLNPNVAKVKINITNSSGGNAIDGENEITQLVNVQVCNVPSGIRFAQNALIDANLFTSADNVTSMGTPISYDIEQLDLTSGESASFEWYIPHNECGEGTRPDPNNNVALSLPANQNPTYIEIDGVRRIDFIDTAYKVYLGTNESGAEYKNIKNFDVVADHKYTVNATITNNGLSYNVINNSDTEGAKTATLVKLPSNSNSYMIHPIGSLIKNGESTVYELPIDRINEYWKDIADDAEMYLDDTSTWKFFVIWQDIPERAIQFTDKNGTVLEYTHPDTKEIYTPGKGLNPVYFKLVNNSTDPDNQTYGNILVGVRKDAQSGYLWSWHLWITDYNPDAALPYSLAKSVNSETSNFLCNENGSQNIDLQGYWNYSGGYKRTPFGNVQHWTHKHFPFVGTDSSLGWSSSSATYWGESGIYANSWIMDRHLGSQSPNGMDNQKDPRDAYGLYYQYGRKDPFPFSNYTENGSTNVDKGRQLYDITGENKVYWDFDTQLGAQTIKAAVKDPLTFFGHTTTGRDWCSETDPMYLWRSPVDIGETGKSIFDPCPPGWSIPVYEAFDYMTYPPQSTVFQNTSTIEIYDTRWPQYYSYVLQPYNIYIRQGTIGVNTANGCIEDQRNSAIYTFVVDNIPGKSSPNLFWAVFPLQPEIHRSSGLLIAYNKGCMWTANPSGEAGGFTLTTSNTSGTTYNKEMAASWTQTVSELSTSTSFYTRNTATYRVYNGRMFGQGFNRARGHNIRCIQTPNPERLKYYNKK